MTENLAEPPDHRGHSSNQPQLTSLGSASDHISPSLTQSQISASRSYSNIAANSLFPSKDQGIPFPSIDWVKLEEYIFAVGAKIFPKNITFASRISNNRVCIYLSNKSVVDHFMATYSSITINNQDIQARRLITPASRITLSNVCPTIPHGTLEIELKKLDLNLVSPVTFIKIGVSNPEYGHIFSFRRQVFTSPLSPESNIPESFTLTYENTLYRIFVSVDGLTCFKCKQPGHIAVNCCNAPSAPNSESPPKPSDKSSSSKKTPSTKDSIEASQSIVNIHLNFVA